MIGVLGSSSFTISRKSFVIPPNPESISAKNCIPRKDMKKKYFSKNLEFYHILLKTDEMILKHDLPKNIIK